MKRVFTIPNLLSLLRICLIPFIVWMYFDASIPRHYLAAMLLVVLSGLTDVVDGFIARHFNMVSDVGKLLDPAADKLTQAAVVICLATAHRTIIPLVVLIVVKELLMLFGAIKMMRSTKITPYAKWWGKLSTLIVYALMVYVLISDIYPAIPEWSITLFAVIACVSMLFSLLSYYGMFRRTTHGEDPRK